jgi:ribosomal protein uL22
MTDARLEARGEKIKEKLEEKAKERAEEKAKEAEGVKVEEKKKEEVKPAPKKEVKKPVVTEAKARTEFMPISFKESVEICRAIRGLSTKKAENYLNDVIAHKRPIKYIRYHTDTPHRKGKGFGPGRFPAKSSKFILGVLKNAVANAQYLNLDKENLYVKISKADRSMSKEKQGRYSTIEIIVAESKETKKETPRKKKAEAKVKKTAGMTPKVSEKVTN